MLTDRESLETAATAAFDEADLPAGVPAGEIFKYGFYAGFRAAKLEEQEALLKSMTAKK